MSRPQPPIPRLVHSYPVPVVLERQAGDQFEVGRQSVDTIRSIDLSSIGLPFRIDTYV